MINSIPPMLGDPPKKVTKNNSNSSPDSSDKQEDSQLNTE